MLPKSPAAASAVYTLGDGRTVRTVEPLGFGEHATVYRAWLEDAYKLRRPVALKVFDRAAVDGDALAKLARAVRHAAYLNHGNVTDVLAIGVTEGGRPFVLTELVRGCSLERLAATYARSSRRVPTDLALFIAIEVAEGLLAARHVETTDGTVMGITHHDLSPRQVLLSWDGEVKVSDFGVRVALPESSGVRDRGAIVRRVNHLAPEVVKGARGNARSDVFALGVILHELLRGPRFPAGADGAEVMRLATEGTLRAPITAPVLSSELADVLSRAVAVDPAERTPHAGVFAYDLRRVALGMGVGEGRAFLRRAMGEMSEGLYAPDPTVVEVAQPVSERAARFDEGEATERVSLDDVHQLAESGEVPVRRRA